jgi:hypothetical protein
MSRLPLLIIAGILVWSSFLAIGAFRLNHHWGRAVAVFGCALAFIAFWSIMLAVRRRRLQRETVDEQEPE